MVQRQSRTCVASPCRRLRGMRADTAPAWAFLQLQGCFQSADPPYGRAFMVSACIVQSRIRLCGAGSFVRLPR
jgi:hypothetical protein